MPAQTIDDVIQRLDNIIDRAYSQKSRLGYFAALYRKVTIGVNEGIAEGIFEDGERMERLDVIFANFYLQALAQYRDNQATTRSWKFAFDASKRWWPIVEQQLASVWPVLKLLGYLGSRTDETLELEFMHNTFKVG